ncbi:MAG: LiaF domain-containing protein [Sphingobacteriales bacterium]
MSFQSTVMPDAEDYIHSTAVFAGIKKTILSKDFKGGKVSNIFGATELDFTHADLMGTALLDISQAFGEVSITVPADWRVEADVSQLMAVVEDFRNDVYRSKNSDKVLILKGISFCANVEIMN